jgi:cyclase
MLNAIGEKLSIPLIASGGAGCAEDFVTLFQNCPKADAGLAASIFHFRQVEIRELKKLLKKNNILVRG